MAMYVRRTDGCIQSLKSHGLLIQLFDPLLTTDTHFINLSPNLTPVPILRNHQIITDFALILFMTNKSKNRKNHVL